ncbi:MAG TPA: methyltransferase domain-containing protein [Terriglobales bacterium]
MERRADLSGAAFCNVDGSGYAAKFVSYLDIAADQFASLKSFSYSVLQLRRGDRVLDVGCGCGDDLRKMATLISPTGRAVGIDISKLMIEEARRRNAARALPIDFEVGQATDLRWGSDVFDACRADRVLQHLPDPQQAVNEMVRVLKPGGRIVVMDRDWGMVALDSSDPVTTGIVLHRAQSGIRNGWIGRQLWRLFQSAGVNDVEVVSRSLNLRDFEIADTLLDLRQVLEHAIAEELVGKAAAEQWIDDLLERDAAGQFFATITLYLAYGVKASVSGI